MEVNKNQQHQRIFGLDIIRALAIVFVVMGHGAFLIDNTAIEAFPYVRLIDGVDLFFVLSGFLIGGILLKRINKSDQFDIAALFNFWKRRWFRTLPNYYLVLILNAIFAFYHFNPTNFSQFNWSFFLFVQNFHTPFSGFFWESWSLSIEEWFYIFSPLLIFFFLKRFKAKQAFILATFIMILLPTLYRVFNYSEFMNYWQWDIGVRKIVLSRLDSIGYGLLAAWIHYYFPDFWKKCRWPTIIIALTGNYLLTHFIPEPGTFYRQVLVFSASSLVAMFMLPMAHFIKNGRGFLARAITHISKISYSMYLIHFGLIALTIKKHFFPVNELDAIIKYGMYWLLVIVLSSFLYRYFELPMTKLRDHPFFNKSND